jgi:hypothetical protein
MLACAPATKKEQDRQASLLRTRYTLARVAGYLLLGWMMDS